MTGTFGGALEARGIKAEDRLTGRATGEIVKEGDVLIVRKIHVDYYLKAAPVEEETVRRVHGFHMDHCPTAMTIRKCVDISTSLAIEPL